MRLTELLTEYDIPRSVHKVPTSIDFRDAPPADISKQEVLGTGYYSTVRGTEERPEDAIKGSRTLYPNTKKFRKDIKVSNLADGYYVFIKELSKSPQRDNPFFPRVRKFDVYQTPKKAFSYTVELERLYPLKSATKKEVGHILRTLGGSQYEQLKNYCLSRMQFGEFKIDKETTPWDALTRMLVAVRTFENFFENEDFLAALDFIKAIADKHKYYVDLHDGNVMIRRTATGAQFVIVDPLGMPNEDEWDR